MGSHCIPASLSLHPFIWQPGQNKRSKLHLKGLGRRGSQGPVGQCGVCEPWGEAWRRVADASPWGQEELFSADLLRPCSPITHDSYLVTSLQPQVHLLLTRTEQIQNPDMVIAASTVTTTLTDKCVPCDFHPTKQETEAQKDRQSMHCPRSPNSRGR